MEKTITIDGKEIRFKSTGATALRYKSQFRKDLFQELFKMGGFDKVINKKTKDINPADLEGLDFDLFYEIAWVMAKTADPSIPDPIAWLDRFDEFPMMEIIPQLTELISSTLQSNKKK